MSLALSPLGQEQEFNPKFTMGGELGKLASQAIYEQTAGGSSYGGTSGIKPTTGYNPVNIPGVGDSPAMDGITNNDNFGGALGNFFKNKDGSFNAGNLKLALGGIQTIGALWNAHTQSKLAKKSLALQTRAFETNLANQTKSYNTELTDRIKARHAFSAADEDTDAYIRENKL